MASVNKVILIGNLTRDPELRFTPKGSGLCELGLAVNRKYKLDSGETREEVTFIDVTFWGKQAEVVSKWMKKGNPMYIEGRLQLDTWDDKTSGQKRSKLRVVAEDFQFLGSGERAPRGAEESYDDSRSSAPPTRSAPQQQQPQQQAQRTAAPSAHRDEDGPINLDEDEIPF
jgi:single-strand DNA-binding protein